MSTSYDLAHAFFERLATDRAALPGGRALANLQAPLLLANAAWYPTAGALQSLAGWYAARGLGPALVAPAAKSAALARSLEEGPFALERRFAWLTLAPDAHDTGPAVVVEQVGWAQARVVGDLLAAQDGLPDYGAALGATLARAMQEGLPSAPVVFAFVAYETAEHSAVGSLVAFAHEGALAAMLHGGLRDALLARLRHEAQSRALAPVLLKPLAPDAPADESGLELWSVR